MLKVISLIKKYRFRYLLNHSRVIVEPGGVLEIEPGVQIHQSTIYIGSGGYLKLSSNCKLSESNLYIDGTQSKAEIGTNCSVDNADIAVWTGKFSLGNYSIIENAGVNKKTRISIDGTCEIGEYNRIRSSIWVRFNGKLSIGKRNAINEGTEIRCDELVEVGDYNQISYDCTVWDTNTHCLYSTEKRRELTDKQYPGFGEETERPITDPVKIGSDCWLGKGCTLLKGTTIGDQSLIGYGTLISGKQIPTKSKVVSKSVLSISSIES